MWYNLWHITLQKSMWRDFLSADSILSAACCSAAYKMSVGCLGGKLPLYISPESCLGGKLPLNISPESCLAPRHSVFICLQQYLYSFTRKILNFGNLKISFSNTRKYSELEYKGSLCYSVWNWMLRLFRNVWFQGKKSDLRFDLLGFFEIFDLRDLEMTGKHVIICKHGKNRGSTVQSSINSGLSAWFRINANLHICSSEFITLI